MLELIIAILFLLLPPCPTEDSANCSWDASSQGNGAGSSFIDLGGRLFFV